MLVIQFLYMSASHTVPIYGHTVSLLENASHTVPQYGKNLVREFLYTFLCMNCMGIV